MNLVPLADWLDEHTAPLMYIGVMKTYSRRMRGHTWDWEGTARLLGRERDLRIELRVDPDMWVAGLVIGDPSLGVRSAVVGDRWNPADTHPEAVLRLLTAIHEAATAALVCAWPASAPVDPGGMA